MIESPCINVCKLDEATGLCIGCLRSIDEIGAWRDATLEQKEAILEAASERRQRYLAIEPKRLSEG